MYCMEIVNFNGENRPAMLVHAEANLHCSMVLEKLLHDGGEPLPAKPLDGKKEEKRKALWKDLRDFFAKEDDEQKDAVRRFFLAFRQCFWKCFWRHNLIIPNVRCSVNRFCLYRCHNSSDMDWSLNKTGKLSLC